ncbi:MAG: alpha/beta fold hydrolase [Ignavibacteriales bacterium]|nr:alpha/beta fold hydrolase [Ignavibacteriales bacterium]
MSIDRISTTLVHKVRPPATSVPAKPPALILLHGRGTNEDDLLGLADFLDPRFFIVSARAPYRFEQGHDSYAWFGLQEIGKPDAQQFSEAYHHLTQFIEDVKTGYPVDPARVFLLGFSMGSIMAFAVALTQPNAVRGIVAHSGYIPESVSLQFAWTQLSSLSVFIAHGLHDPVIPIQKARRAQELLSKTEADLTYKEYPIQHTISEESLADLSQWLQKKLDVPADMK